MSVATAAPTPPTRAQAALLAVRHAAGEDLEPLGAAALDEDIDVLLRISDTAQAEAARRLRRREQLPASAGAWRTSPRPPGPCATARSASSTPR